MLRFAVISLIVAGVVLAVWFSPPVQRWKQSQVEQAYIQHFEAKHRPAERTPLPSEHDHYYDQEMFPSASAPPETLFIDRAGRMVLRVDDDTVRVEMPPWPDEDYPPGHRHFGLDSMRSEVVEALHDDHLMDALLDHANTLAVIITVLGTAVANIYWKFKQGPQ